MTRTLEMITRQPVYPMFPASSWWPLRRQFKRRMPPLVDAPYLATVLGIEAKTARNLLPTLRNLGLINGDGVPTERAHRWRVDTTYAEVCRELRDELYPQDLFLRVPDPEASPDSAIDWFMGETGVGAAAARRMARMYELLMQADPAEEDEHADRRRSRSIALKRTPRDEELETDFPADPSQARPVQLHFHFEGDLSPQQIEKIFQSMGRYLGRSDK